MNADTVWLPPCGEAKPLDKGGYADLEKLLDGDSVAAPQHDAGYWGQAKGAHFWGGGLAPVRRAVAAVVPVRDARDTPADLAAKAEAYKKRVYEEKMATSVWPRGSPVAFSATRELGLVPAKKVNRVVVCSASVKGLYLAPLSAAQVKAAAQKLSEDLNGAVRPTAGLKVTSLRAATDGGARVTFELPVTAADAKDATRRVKSALTSQALLSATCAFYAGTRVRPVPGKLLLNDLGKLQLVCVRRGCVRGTPPRDMLNDASGTPNPKAMAAVGAAAGASSTSAARAAAGGYSGGAAAASTSAARPASGVSSSSSSPAGSPRPKPVLTATGATAAERKKNLLGNVLKKTKAALNEVEMSNPKVQSTYELQRRKEALNQANQALAESKGEGLKQLIASARDTLRPPSEWRGALVREDRGRRMIENFDLNLVDLSRETRTMVGRARIQNQKMDMTYQCKARVLQKDNSLTVELVLDNSGVCMGKFAQRGVMTGTFKFPNGSGTFKLTRAEI